MAEYIEREALIAAMCADFCHVQPAPSEPCEGCHMVKEILDAHAADVVSRAAFDQIMWERDLAIQQLREDYGVELGEKKVEAEADG